MTEASVNVTQIYVGSDDKSISHSRFSSPRPQSQFHPENSGTKPHSH